MLTIVGFGEVADFNSGVSALRVFACGRGIASFTLLSGIECVQAHHNGANCRRGGAPVRQINLSQNVYCWLSVAGTIPSPLWGEG